MASAPPPTTMRGEEEGGSMKVCQNFVVTNFFFKFCQDKLLWVELKINGGVIIITILLLCK